VQPGAIDGFIQYTVVAVPFALFTAYVGHLLRQLQAERDRGRRALAEARVLQAVTAAGLRHVARPDRFVAETVAAVRRGGVLRAFAIVYDPPSAADEADSGSPEVAGFGPIHGLAAAVQRGERPPDGRRRATIRPLAQAGRRLGTLLADGPDLESRRTFLAALAGQVSAALANAHLYAEAEALAAQAERARLGREIHDGIAQSLFMLTLSLEACAELVERDPARLRERLETLITLARQTLWQTRHYIHDLKPLFQREHGLRSAIDGLIKEFRAVSGLAVELAVAGEEPATSPAVKQALYRIAQEGLANVFKHAVARRVGVTLAFEPAGIALTIEDDGRGFAPPAGDGGTAPGFGLATMRERAEELGGRFDLASRPGHGTRLAVRLPHREGRRTMDRVRAMRT
jgi:signal transduction histidine kinase